ncbi:hypothetical protein D3C77_624030 [compost metagenome]
MGNMIRKIRPRIPKGEQNFRIIPLLSSQQRRLHHQDDHLQVIPFVSTMQILRVDQEYIARAERVLLPIDHINSAAAGDPIDLKCPMPMKSLKQRGHPFCSGDVQGKLRRQGDLISLNGSG